MKGKPSSMLPQGTTYTMSPDWLARRTDISGDGKRLWARLNRYGEKIFPSRDTLAGELGISVRTVDRRVKELKSAGLVEVSERYYGRTNTYRVITPAALPEDESELPKKASHPTLKVTKSGNHADAQGYQKWQPMVTKNGNLLVTKNGNLEETREETRRGEGTSPRREEKEKEREAAAFVAAAEEEVEEDDYARWRRSLDRLPVKQRPALARMLVVTGRQWVVRQFHLDGVLDESIVSSLNVNSLMGLSSDAGVPKVLEAGRDAPTYCPERDCIQMVTDSRQCPVHD